MLLEWENCVDFINAKQTNLSWHSCVWRDLEGEFATVSWWLPLSLGDEAVCSFREQMHIEINTGEWSSSVHLHSALCKKKRNWHSHPGIVWGSTLVNFHVTETAQNKDVCVIHPSAGLDQDSGFNVPQVLHRPSMNSRGIILSIHQHTSLCGLTVAS